MIDLNDDGTFSFRDISAPSRRLVAAHDYDLDAANDWLQDQIREAFDEWSTEPLRAYLGSYGDAVTERVQSALAEAQGLHEAGHAGPATSLAYTGVEASSTTLSSGPSSGEVTRARNGFVSGGASQPGDGGASLGALSRRDWNPRPCGHLDETAPDT